MARNPGDRCVELRRKTADQHAPIESAHEAGVGLWPRLAGLPPTIRVSNRLDGTVHVAGLDHPRPAGGTEEVGLSTRGHQGKYRPAAAQVFVQLPRHLYGEVVAKEQEEIRVDETPQRLAPRKRPQHLHRAVEAHLAGDIHDVAAIGELAHAVVDDDIETYAIQSEIAGLAESPQRLEDRQRAA